MRKLVNIDRDTPMLLPCDLREWVAADDLVHFVLEAVEGTDLGEARVNERGSGSAQYPPGMLLGLLIYSYALGTFSSRKIERLSYQHLGVRYLCANTHPDHDTIATFRRQNKKLFLQSFAAVMGLARTLGLPQLGTVHIDGTKLPADASPRRQLGMAEVTEQLEAAERRLAETLYAQAEAADRTDPDAGQRLPPELADAQRRKARLAEAREQLAAREALKKKPATINLTDPDSRLMPTGRGAFFPGYNAQVAVDERGLIVGQTVIQASNDRGALPELAAQIAAQRGEIGYLVADQGYDNQEHISSVEEKLDTTVISRPQNWTLKPKGRERPDLFPLAAERRQRGRLATSFFGRALLHQRQTTIEPLFGYVKHVLGFRRFHMRGLEKVRAEWSLLTAALNCRLIWQRKLAQS